MFRFDIVNKEILTIKLNISKLHVSYNLIDE